MIVIRLYKYIFVLDVSTVKVMFTLITTNLYDKRPENSSEVRVFIGERIRLILEECIVFEECDNVKVKQVFMCLQAMVHMVQYVKIDILILIIAWFCLYREFF